MAHERIFRNNRRAFTLVELLVVISIIGLLSSIAVVSMSGARNKARLAAGQDFDASIQRSIGNELIGEWLFDEASATTAADTSGLEKNGTVTGATPVMGYNGKSALSFNGGANYVNIPYGWTASGQSFTVTAWVYDTGNGIDEIIFDANIWMVSMNIRNSNIACITNSDTWRTGAANTLPKNTWVHVACVFDALPSTLSGYTNGALMFSTTDNAPAVNLTQIRINGDTNGNYHLTGFIDDIRLYASSLNAEAIRKLYAQGANFHKNLADTR